MADNRVILKGITWNHSRGFVPMVATGQRFGELNPGIEVVWEKRSLQQFADLSIEELAKKYDLLVIDHPWAGFAAETGSILPLDEYIPADFLADQRLNSVGRSFESYSYHDHQWALPIDAATPVASSRPDLFDKHNIALPDTYDDLVSLAKRGLVAFSLIPIDTLMSFYMFCCSLGEDPGQSEHVFISESTGVRALQLFKQLAGLVDPESYNRNPIQVYEAMTQTDEIAYCPFAYGYSNYSREGYSRTLLHYHDLVSLDGTRLTTTLGGTGLAVSASGSHKETAVKYACYVASATCQQTLYFNNGGQPGYLAAWKNDEVNAQTARYFQATLPALQRAFLRPRYHGHMFFQDHAGDIVRDYVRNGGDASHVLRKLNMLYLESRNVK